MSKSKTFQKTQKNLRISKKIELQTLYVIE